MPRLLQPLWFILASVTDRNSPGWSSTSRRRTAYSARGSPGTSTTPRERSHLVKLGKKVGSAINELISIVTPRSFARWLRGTGFQDGVGSTRKPGRPRTAEEIRDLILRLASGDRLGLQRVLGELKKLGIRTVSKTTVANILREAGIDPGPKRGEGTWSDFVIRHASTLWAADFLSVRTLTTRGFVELYVLVFIHYGSRNAFVAGRDREPGRPVGDATSSERLDADGRMGIATESYPDRLRHEVHAIVRRGLRGRGREGATCRPMAPNLNSVIERFFER